MRLDLEKILAKMNSWNSYNPYMHPLDSILKDVPKGGLVLKKELIESLEKSIVIQEEHFLDNIISLCIYDGIDKSFTKILCDLLLENWHDCHEDIIVLLEKVNDERSINALYEAAINIPEFDDARALAKKCIFLLKQINTIESIEKIQKLSKSEDNIIKEFSGSYLNQK